MAGGCGATRGATGDATGGATGGVTGGATGGATGSDNTAAGAVARRSLPHGALSADFTVQQLKEQLLMTHTDTAYCTMEWSGLVVAARGVTAAGVAARCRLAGGPGEVGLWLEGAAAGGDGGALRLRVAAAAPPHHELRLWPAASLLPSPGTGQTAADVCDEYRCESCCAHFSESHALVVHRVLRRAPPSPAPCTRRFLLEVVRRLERRQLPAPRPHSAVPAPPPPPPPADSVRAALRALAALWPPRAPPAPAGHVCPYCGRVYSRRYGLKIHVRTHTGYRPLRCAHCGRAFGDPSNLNKHVRLHDRGRGGERGNRVT